MSSVANRMSARVLAAGHPPGVEGRYMFVLAWVSALAARTVVAALT